MKLFRLLLVLALMPVTAYSGLPHVACRCSNGELRLHCPKLERARKAQNRLCCERQKNVPAKRCCCGSRAGCDRSDQNGADQLACGVSGCQCTPVLITSDVGPKLAKVSVPDLQIDLADISDTTGILVRVVRPDVFRVESKPDVPIDRIVLFERFLV